MSDYQKHYHYDLFYKLSQHPVYITTIAKSGCTYLKNLIFYLEHGKVHPLGDRIHDDESLMLRADRSDDVALRETPYKFIVLRDPARRFYSLYCDKIYGRGEGAMHWFKSEVAPDIGLNLNPDLDRSGHQKNAMKLLRWIGKNLRGETQFSKDFHWRRQKAKYDRVKGFAPKVLTLETLDVELPELLAPVVPEIKVKMEEIRSLNMSEKPLSFDAFMSDDVRQLVENVYRVDYKLLATSRHGL